MRTRVKINFNKNYELFNIFLGMVDRENINGKNEKCAPGRLKSLQSFQVLLLRHALLNFPSAKKVVYSTCSIYPEENENVIEEILSDIGEAYKLVSPKQFLQENWINFSSLDYECRDNCLYARPEVDLTNGFFVAVFERNFEVPLPEYKRKSKVKGEENSNFKKFGKDGNSQKKKFKSKLKDDEEKKLEKEIEKTEKTSERQLTASQKKRMRKRKKLNHKNPETLRKEETKVQKENENGEIPESKENCENLKQKKHKKKNKNKLKEDESTGLENLSQKLEDSVVNEKSNSLEKFPESKTALNEENDHTIEKSNKKKKKRKHVETADFIPLNVETMASETENPSPKKKKKKKKY